YELLAGRPPFEGDNPLSVALAHQRQSPAPLSALKPGLDERLVAAVDRAMSKDAGDRFPDAASFRAALGEAQSAFAVAEAAAPTLALGAQTMRLPAGGAPIDADSPGSRSGWLAAVGVAALLGFAAFAVSDIRAGEEPGARAAPTAEERSSPPATPTAAEPAPAETAPDAAPTAPVESEPAPTDIEGLIAQLRDDPQAAGEKGEDLRELLEKVVGERGRNQREEADKAIEEIVEWTEKGELDSATGELAVELLHPLAASPGRGDDDNDDDDDDD
ncbi:MAG TPA: hypothetical protein VML96_07660, partial [Egibacteraceae bacterium]|nr:hypothetical protein [Egibacteraceae bacterium]